MATPGGDKEESPPAYDHLETEEPDALVQPVILVMEGRFIYAESAQSKPLFEVAQDISKLSHAYSTHSFSRLDHVVKDRPGQSPRVYQRTRHIYNLKHVSPAISPNYLFQIEPTSRKSAGHLGLRKSHIPWQGLRIVLTKENPEATGLPKGYQAARNTQNETGHLFEMRRRNQKYEWATTADSRRVAVEDEADGQHKLIFMAPLTRQVMDALVASWCLRLWQGNCEATPKPDTRPSFRECRSRPPIVPRGGPLAVHLLIADSTAMQMLLADSGVHTRRKTRVCYLHWVGS